MASIYDKSGLLGKTQAPAPQQATYNPYKPPAPGSQGSAFYYNTLHPDIDPMSGAPKKKKETYEQKRLRIARREMNREAKSFEKQVPELENQQYRGLLNTYNNQLDQGLRNTAENYSARGLLYSGMRAADESGLRSQVANELAKSRVGINQELQKVSQQKKEAAAAMNLEAIKEAKQRAEELYDTNMSNQIARSRAMESLIGGVGYGAGAYLGGAFDNSGGYNPGQVRAQQSQGYYGPGLLGVEYPEYFKNRLGE